MNAKNDRPSRFLWCEWLGLRVAREVCLDNADHKRIHPCDACPQAASLRAANHCPGEAEAGGAAGPTATEAA